MSALPKPALIPYIVAGSFFMEALDSTVIVTALPKMAESFGSTAAATSIGISAYVLTAAVFVPASGWCADRFGARTVFVAAIGLFTLASMLCGLAVDLPSFTAARMLQGFAAALMSPVGRLVVMRNTEKKDLIRAIATITWPALIAPVLGPPIGGFFTDYLSWRWIFFLNLPFGLVGMAVVARFVPNHRADTVQRFDTGGFLLNGAGLGAIMAALDLATHGAAGGLAALLGAVGIGLGMVAIRRALRHTQPLVDLAAARVPTFAITTVLQGALMRVAITVTPFLLPLMLQIGFGMDAFTSGLLTLIYFAGNLAMKVVTTPILHRFAFRPVLLTSGMLIAASMVGCALLQPDTPLLVTAAILFGGGLVRSMAFTSLNTLAFADIPQRLMSGATVLTSILFQITLGLGVALGALLLNLAVVLRGGSTLAPDLVDFHVAFLGGAALALVAALGMLQLERHAGAAIRTARKSA